MQARRCGEGRAARGGRSSTRGVAQGAERDAERRAAPLPTASRAASAGVFPGNSAGKNLPCPVLPSVPPSPPAAPAPPRQPRWGALLTRVGGGGMPGAEWEGRGWESRVVVGSACPPTAGRTKELKYKAVKMFFLNINVLITEVLISGLHCTWQTSLFTF